MQRSGSLVFPTVLAAFLFPGLLAHTGCEKKASPAQKRVSLLFDGEVEELRTTFAAIASDNAARSCKRPVLRAGPFLEGKADMDMLALLAADGAMQACYTKLDALEASIENEAGVLGLLRDEPGRNPQQESSLVALQDSCSPLPGVLSRAVSHEDACSPYLPGRRGQGSLLGLLKLSKAAVIVSRKLAEDRKRLEAVQLLLDTLRFGQDLSRGGTTLIEPMLAHASHRMLRPELDLRVEGLSVDELQGIDGELALLIGSHPHHSEYFDGMRDSIAIYDAWPPLEGDGWQPPGGFPIGHTGPVKLSEADGPTEEEAAVFLWIVARDTAKLQHEHCGKSVALRACIRAIDSEQETLRQTAKPDLGTIIKMAALSDATARDAILEVLRALAIADYSKYLVRIEEMRIALLAQRRKVQSLIAAQQEKPCPVPVLGDDEDARPRAALEEGEIRFHLPQWLVERALSDEEKLKSSEALAHLRCS